MRKDNLRDTQNYSARHLCSYILGTRVPLKLHIGYFEEDKKDTAAAIDRFHSQMNADQFGQIYDDADEMLQKAPDREVLIKAMQQTKARWGSLKEVTFSKMNVVEGHQWRFMQSTT